MANVTRVMVGSFAPFAAPDKTSLRMALGILESITSIISNAKRRGMVLSGHAPEVTDAETQNIFHMNGIDFLVEAKRNKWDVNIYVSTNFEWEMQDPDLAGGVTEVGQ